MLVVVIPLTIAVDDGKGSGYRDAGLPLDRTTLILLA